MSIIFSKLQSLAEDFKTILNQHSFRKDEHHPFPWDNLIYESAFVRRAHLDIVDRIESKKLFMMHLCVFPKVTSPAPIYGFDIIAGPNKVTGAFLDFSPTGDPEHPLCEWFNNEVRVHNWSRERELPGWAKPIFSKCIVAAGNIQSEFELDDVIDLAKSSLLRHLDGLMTQSNLHSYEDKQRLFDFTAEQNRYCINQKQNPHTPRVMASLGFEPKMIEEFIQNCLFPEV